ncbi:MAG TPA: hypothetical protein VLV88_04645 [Terriglobales bacterium]|nr:hypothetical protein [Terriglobales bacterium]
MRNPAPALSAQYRRGPVFLILFLSVSAFIAYEAAQLIIAEQMTYLAFAGLAFIVVAGVVVILNDWKRGVYLFVGWLLFEDFARKFLGNNMAIYFAKDMLVSILYLSFFIAYRAKKIQTFRPPFLMAFLIFFWLGLVQVFNPGSSSFFYGILGMKLYFLYVPLMLVGYSLINSETELRQFFFANSILILAIAGLGIAQSIIGPSFLNPAHLQADIRELSSTYRYAPITGELAYRPTSVFVSMGRFQDFLIVSWLISLGFGGYLILRSRRGRLLAFGTIAVVAGASFMSASRGVFLWNMGSGLVIAAAFLWGAPWRQREAIRALRAIQRSLLVVGLALMALVAVFPRQFGARVAVYSETLLPSSSASELTYRAETYPMRNFLLAFDYPRWPYGYGIGTASLGAQYVARIMRVPPMNVGVENGYGQLIVELGIGGLILWIVMGTAICTSAWKIVKDLKGSPWLPIGFVIFWYVFLLLFPMGYMSLVAYQDFVMNAYFWLLLGILFRLPSIAISAQYAADSDTTKPHRRWMS